MARVPLFRIAFFAVVASVVAAPAPQLRERLASGAYGAFDEIVFATRTISTDPQ